MNDLTQNQQAVYNAICDIIQRDGEEPTLKNLKEELDGVIEIASLNSIVQYLKSLEKKGYIYRQKNKKGGIHLVDNSEKVEDSINVSGNFFSIPILGLANCGDPVAFAESAFEGTVKVSRRLLPSQKAEGVFMVKVSGDSMNKRGLQDGDYAIIKHYEYCGSIANGDIVLAIVNGLATIKTFFKTIDSIILKPESTKKKHQPIFLHPEDNFFINGKLVGVFKNS